MRNIIKNKDSDLLQIKVSIHLENLLLQNNYIYYVEFQNTKSKLTKEAKQIILQSQLKTLAVP